MASEALGLLECKGLVALMEGSDAMLKAANVEMMGWDKAGSGMVTAFVRATWPRSRPPSMPALKPPGALARSSACTSSPALTTSWAA